MVWQYKVVLHIVHIGMQKSKIQGAMFPSIFSPSLYLSLYSHLRERAELQRPRWPFDSNCSPSVATAGLPFFFSLPPPSFSLYFPLWFSISATFISMLVRVRYGPLWDVRNCTTSQPAWGAFSSQWTLSGIMAISNATFSWIKWIKLCMFLLISHINIKIWEQL